MSRYRSHPDYSAGFEDGWRGQSPRSSGPAYVAGHASATAIRAALTGDVNVPDISFHVRLPAVAPAAA